MAITNGYATLEIVKEAARITDTMSDALLELAIESSSRLIDGHCQRHFYLTTSESRYFAADNSRNCVIDDVSGSIAVATSSSIDNVYDQTWASTDLQLEPLNRVSSGLTFPISKLLAVGDYLFPVASTGETAVRVTATFGFGTAIPTAVQQAAVILSLRQFKRFDSPLGAAGFGDVGIVFVRKIDPDIHAMLAPYRRNVIGLA